MDHIFIHNNVPDTIVYDSPSIVRVPPLQYFPLNILRNSEMWHFCVSF